MVVLSLLPFLSLSLSPSQVEEGRRTVKVSHWSGTESWASVYAEVGSFITLTTPIDTPTTTPMITLMHFLGNTIRL